MRIRNDNDTRQRKGLAPSSPGFELRPWHVVLALLAYIGAFAVYAVFIQTVDDRGVVGDSFGALTAFVTGIAMLGTVGAILLQREELKAQRQQLQAQLDEMIEQRKEMAAQRAEMEESRKVAADQAWATAALALTNLGQIKAGVLIYPDLSKELSKRVGIDRRTRTAGRMSGGEKKEAGGAFNRAIDALDEPSSTPESRTGDPA